MRVVGVAICCLGLLSGLTDALAAACRNPQALGTSRTLTITAAEYPKVGSVHYPSAVQLPLNDHEIVLTFDDGPLSPYTEQVLDTLAKECVKATFFLVGRQASAAPALVKRIYNEGHTIGTHSQNHPLTFDQMPFESAQREIADGISSVTEALGDARAVAPFFRTP
ncbi:MAG: polysaccharide deacetylase family protein, partial [Pseudolabrys sp.]|nr:polysaccharide deacetylase family protein [Pseudolabrys sp.]